VAISTALGILIGVRAVVSVTAGGVRSLLGLAPLPRVTFGVRWSDAAVWPDSIQAHALTRMAGALLVLALAASSVAILNAIVLLAEAGASRRREMALRAALGGSPRVLVARLLADVRVLFAGGFVLGILLGLTAGGALRVTWPGTLGGVAFLSATAEGLAPALLLAALTAVAYTLAGLGGSHGRPLAAELSAGGRTTDEGRAVALRRALAAFQMAVAGSVLCATLVLTMAEQRSHRNAAQVPSDVSVVDVTAPHTPGDDWGRILAQLASVPGMKAESLAASGALAGLGVRDGVEAQCGECIIGLMYVPMLAAVAVHSTVGPGFFGLTGRHVVEGREFTPADRAGSEPVAIINRTFAEADFHNGEALGHQIQVGTDLKRWYTVVGVVDDEGPAAVGGPDRARPAVWLSALQHPPARADVILRGTPDAVRAGVATLDAAGWSPGPASTLRERRARAAAPLVWAERASLVLALLALLLAIHGMHATSRQITRRRFRELAIRRALGATDGRLLRHALGGTLRTSLWGAFGAMLGGTFLVALLREGASGVPAPPVSVYMAVTAVLVASAVAASWRAAREALRVAPAAVLE
jgi:hypothetical protein